MSYIPLERPRQHEIPEKGKHPAVCIGWSEADPRPDGQPCIRLRYQLTTRDSTGRRYQVSRKFTRTITGRSALRWWLGEWRGTKTRYEDLADGLWLDGLKGIPGVLEVDHWTSPSDGIVIAIAICIAPWNYREGPAPTVEEIR